MLEIEMSGRENEISELSLQDILSCNLSRAQHISFNKVRNEVDKLLESHWNVFGPISNRNMFPAFQLNKKRWKIWIKLLQAIMSLIRSTIFIYSERYEHNIIFDVLYYRLSG